MDEQHRQTLEELRKFRDGCVEDGVFSKEFEQDRTGRWIPEPRLRRLDRIIRKLEKEEP